MRGAFIAVAVALSGCSTIGAIGGNTSDCTGAQKQLGIAKAALSVAQIALASAQSFGNAPAIALAQTAVNTISSDVMAIQDLVTSTCAVSNPHAHMAFARAPTITLTKAKNLAAADKGLAGALTLRAK